MANSVARISGSVVLAALLAGVAGVSSSEAQVDACSARMANRQVLRADESARRLFILSSEQELLNETARTRVIRDLESLVRSCRPDWGQDWRASFFSDAASAGYKDEAALAERVANGQWASAYVAELESPPRALILFPALSERRRSLATE